MEADKDEDKTKLDLAEAAATDLAAESTVDKKDAASATAEKPLATEAKATDDASAPEKTVEAAAVDDDDDSVKNVPVKSKADATKKESKPAVKAEKPATKVETATSTAAETADKPKEAKEAGEEATAKSEPTTETAPPAAPVIPAVPSPAPEASPKVKELHAMFPAIDIAVIEVVLESVNGSEDRAIEQLLAMNDPDFKPDEATSRQEELARQAALDAEFARALALQEQEDERAQRRAGQHGQAQQPGVLPYQPRVRRQRPDGQTPQQGDGQHLGEGYHRDTQGQQQGGQFDDQLAAFEERVTQIAEQGKQTFNTLFNRAKAKYDEFSQQQAEAARQREAQQAAEGGAAGTAGAQGQGQGLFGGPGWQTRASGVAAGASGLAAGASARLNALWGTQTQQPQQGQQLQPPERTNSTSPAGRQASRWSPTDSYEDVHDAQPLSTTINVGGRASPRDGASPPPTAGNKIDMAKLGFLPKKRVDLMSSSPAPGSTGSATSLKSEESGKSLLDKVPKSQVGETSPHTLGDSDDEDLEYQENPFDKK